MAITNLNLASSSAISTALSNLKSTFNAQNAWLRSSNNKYIIDTLGELSRDFRANTINQADIINYMASSVFIHCFNGWTYLSTAVHALLEGDYGNAIHNAYYAELRSIMSILSSQGIGTFDKSNVIVDSTGRVHEALPRNGRTHAFAKEAFDQWLNDSNNAETILNLISIENSSLKGWINSTGFPPASYLPGQVAVSWLQDWSLDLNIIKKEQHFRNFVSYNPQTFDCNFSRRSDNIRARLQFVVQVWKLCAPNNYFSYSILRNSLEVVYKSLFGYNLSQLDIETDIKPRFVDLGMNPNDVKSEYIIKFLRREIEPADNLIFNYAKNLRFSSPLLETDTDPMGIISRACLLLLINTKIIETIFQQTGTSKADLKFWFDNIGIKSGYWDTPTEPYLYSDLWADIELEIDEINHWLSNPGFHPSPYNFKQNLKHSVTNIRNLNKAYLWGVSS